MFTLWRCWYSGCSHMLTHMHRPFKCCEHKWNINTQKYKHNVLNVMFCGAQRAGCAHIESTYGACNSPYAHISARADFPLMLSTSSSTKQSLCYNFNQTLILYPLHPQLPYHPHTRNLHYHPRTWAEHQLPFGGSCACARSSQPFVWKSFLLMAIWDHRRYRKYAWICGVCASKEVSYLFFGCWVIGDLDRNLEGQNISDGCANMYHEWDCWGKLMIEHDKFCLLFFLCLFMFLRERHWIQLKRVNLVCVCFIFFSLFWCLCLKDNECTGSRG